LEWIVDLSDYAYKGIIADYGGKFLSFIEIFNLDFSERRQKYRGRYLHVISNLVFAERYLACSEKRRKKMNKLRAI